MYTRLMTGLIIAGLLLALPASSARTQDDPKEKVVTRRRAANPSTRVYTNVPGVGIVGYTDVETRWINQVDQLLGQYQQQNPNPVGSPQWIKYVDSLVAWYQQQNPYQFGTDNWRAYNNRIVDWYLRQNPFRQGTVNWQNYASRITGTEQSQVYASPRQVTYEEYMENVYKTNPYAYGSPEWTRYTNYYINEYNRLYGTSNVTPEGQRLTPQRQQFPQQQTDMSAPPDWTLPPATQSRPGGQQPPLPLNWAERPSVRPPTAYPQQDWMTQPGTVQPTVPQQKWMQRPWGVVTMPQQQVTPQTVPPSVGGSTGMTPMAPAAPTLPGGLSGGAGAGR